MPSEQKCLTHLDCTGRHHLTPLIVPDVTQHREEALVLNLNIFTQMPKRSMLTCDLHEDLTRVLGVDGVKDLLLSQTLYPQVGPFVVCALN